MEKECNHQWEEVEKDKRVAGYKEAGFFTDGMVWYEIRILQKCVKCGKQEVMIY